MAKWGKLSILLACFTCQSLIDRIIFNSLKLFIMFDFPWTVPLIMFWLLFFKPFAMKDTQSPQQFLFLNKILHCYLSFWAENIWIKQLLSHMLQDTPPHSVLYYSNLGWTKKNYFKSMTMKFSHNFCNLFRTWLFYIIPTFCWPTECRELWTCWIL